jgi:hypothetical protein
MINIYNLLYIQFIVINFNFVCFKQLLLFYFYTLFDVRDNN